MFHLFFAPWGFSLASKKINPEECISKINEKIISIEKSLKFYDLDAHNSMFCLPKHIKRAIETEGRVIRDDSPLSFY